MLKGPSISLKPFDSRNLDQYREWINDKDIMFYLNRVLPVSDIEHRRWYEKAITDEKSIFFSIYLSVNEVYVGNIWLWSIDYRNSNAELRIFVGERKLWGTGIGSEAMNLLIGFAHKDLNLHKIYAYVHKKNPRAKNAFEKSGFIAEALLKDEFFCDGAFEDVYRMAHFMEISAEPVAAAAQGEEKELDLKGFEASSFQWFRPK
jgi:RimJ/RimL family protein N-acetyltransferase